MKPRKPLKRTPLARTTPLRRTGIARPTPAGVSSEPRNARPKHGPVKARSESTHIPDPIRQAVLARDQHTCQRCGLWLGGGARRYGLQHRRPRQAGGSRLLHTMANLVVLCGWSVDPGTCTAAVELDDRPRATAEGWLVPLGAVPEEWRVWRWTQYGPRWEQPGEIWEVAQPTERQQQMREAA